MSEVVVPTDLEETLSLLNSTFPNERAARQTSMGGFLFAHTQGQRPSWADAMDLRDMLSGSKAWLGFYDNLEGRTELESQQAYALTVFGLQKMRSLRGEMINPVSHDTQRTAYETAKHLSIELARYILNGDPTGSGFVDLLKTIKRVEEITDASPAAFHHDPSIATTLIPPICEDILHARNIRDLLDSLDVLDILPKRDDHRFYEGNVQTFENEGIDVVGMQSSGSLFGAIASLKLEELTGRSFPFKIVVPGVDDPNFFYSPETEGSNNLIWIVEDQAGQTYQRAIRYFEKKGQKTLNGLTRHY